MPLSVADKAFAQNLLVQCLLILKLNLFSIVSELSSISVDQRSFFAIVAAFKAPAEDFAFRVKRAQNRINFPLDCYQWRPAPRRETRIRKRTRQRHRKIREIPASSTIYTHEAYYYVQHIHVVDKHCQNKNMCHTEKKKEERRERERVNFFINDKNIHLGSHTALARRLLLRQPAFRVVFVALFMSFYGSDIYLMLRLASRHQC